MNTEQAAFHFVGAFVDELARAGMRHVVVCPGSRSTPIALMLANEPRLKTWIHLDERSAAFFALGMAKVLRFPVGLLCTSGTAAANFLPAIVEASISRVPLVVLTADRPPELRDTGAAQTIDQIKLYGGFAKWYVEMALPEATQEALRYSRTVASRAVATALAQPSGVVHLNFPFREPLVPQRGGPAGETDFTAAWSGRQAGQVYAQVGRPIAGLASEDGVRLAAELAGLSRGVIVAGPNNEPGLAVSLGQLAHELGYPVLADPLSGMRSGSHDRRNVIDAYDAFLRDRALVKVLQPDVILIFGSIPASKPVLQFLNENGASRQILVGLDWSDPNRLATEQYPSSPNEFCRSVSAALRTTNRASRDIGWLAVWLELQDKARAAVEQATSSISEMFEGRVWLELSAVLPPSAIVWASSSMPVRDLDTFMAGSDRDVRFLSNRGANGIDGVVSSALGVAAVSTHPVVLVIGDIAFYHDMNGLLAAKLHQLKATIVLLNNDGGGIFSFLPQADYPEHFEALFGTPHGLQFESAAGLYGISFSRPGNWTEFRRDLSAGLQGPGLHIIEVRTDRTRNVALHRSIWPQVSAAVHDLKRIDS
jgi:2-succinyl-5-enolpyruvyl-6-hydroxy-3-cyclohexene-1-carboxylate synthase